MAKRLADIEQSILEKSSDFYNHLEKILPSNVWKFVQTLASKTEIYVFSGVIRNYFIGRKFDSLRDIDFIINDEINIESLFPNLSIRKNSFGGYKIIIEKLTVDLWITKNTWALNYGQLKLNFSHLDDLPNTTFFNFSSILFSINNRQFIIGKPFLRFLRDKKLDIVFKENPYPALCIVNSFYYSDKFNLNLSSKLIDYIKTYYKENLDKFDEMQMKHFGEIIYSKNDLLNKIHKVELSNS